jgi:co-chaperonin GroES (HSP10)
MKEKIEPDLRTEAEVFPQVDPGVDIVGDRVLVQLRRTKSKSRGGIVLVQETKDTVKYNEVVAKVVSIGPLAYKSPDTLETWPEGAWFGEGDFVRCPRYGGDRWSVKTGPDEEAIFVIFNELDIVAQVTGNPLAVKAFL